MTSETFLRYLLVFLSGTTFGAAVLYTILRGFLTGVGRAMPFRDQAPQQWSHGANGRRG